MREKFYSFLMQFTNGTTPCRSHLVRKFSAELVDEAVEIGLIAKIGKNTIGDILYTITEKGRNVRDGN